MVDVGVREDNGIEILNGQRKLAILLGGIVPPSLKHPAIERYGVAVDVKEMTGASDFTRGPDERYLQTAILLLLHRARTGW